MISRHGNNQLKRHNTNTTPPPSPLLLSKLSCHVASPTNLLHELHDGFSSTHTDISAFMQQGGDYECGAGSGAAPAAGIDATVEQTFELFAA